MARQLNLTAEQPFKATQTEQDALSVGSNTAASRTPLAAKVKSTGDQQIDTLLSGYKWGVKTITYSFYDDDVPNSYYGDDKVSEVSDGIKNNIRTIFKSFIEPFVNLKFVEVKDTQDSYGLMRFQLVDDPQNYASASYPDSTDYNQGNSKDQAGDVWLSNKHDVNDGVEGFQSGIGSYGFSTLIHEVLHAIGLKHPGDYNGDGSGDPPFLPHAEDNTTNSIMSYTEAGAEPSTPMPYDIKALQYLYGAKQHNVGKTTYVFDQTYGFSDGRQFWGSASKETKVALWDSGGVDTLDFSKLALDKSGYRFDLRAGGALTSQSAYNSETYTPRGSGKTYQTSDSGAFIAYDVTIENLINSTSNDTIIANKVGNTFSGYRTGLKTGKDTIVGSDRLDTLDLSGYKYSDVSQTARGDDLILGLGGNGSITLKEYYSAVEGDRIRILFDGAETGLNILGTKGDDYLKGESGDDLIRGLAGDDILQGRGGHDRLEGGKGDDLLKGDNGRDLLKGGKGDDFLLGGRGYNILVGGQGYDTFAYDQIDHRRDIITDFELGVDQIDLSSVFKDSIYNSANAFNDYVKLVQLGADTKVKIDVLGDNGNHFKTVAQLINVDKTALTADHFVLS